MRKIVYKSRAVQTIIAILALAAIITVWPLRLWQTDFTSSGGGTMTGETAAVDSSHDVVQVFMAQYGRIASVDVYVTELTAGRYMEFSLYDQNMQLIYDTYVDMGKAQIPGYVKIPLQMNLTVNDHYTMLMTPVLASFKVAYEDIPADASPYVLGMSYQDTGVEGYHLAAQYHYSLPLAKKLSLGLMALIFVLAAALTGLTGWYYRKNPQKDRLIMAWSAFRLVMNPVCAVLFAAAALMIFPLKLFDDRPADLIFFELGIFITAALVFYGINHRRDEDIPAGILHFGNAFSTAKAAGQMLAIALAVKFGCEYMNALYDIYHTLAERKMMICLLCLIILTFSAGELFNLYNLLYTVCALIIGVRFYHVHQMAVTQKEYNLHNAALSYAIVVVILGGILLMNLIRLLVTLIRSRRDGQKTLQAPVLSAFGILTILFLIVIVVLRNTRWWGVALAVTYGVFYLRYAVWQDRDRWLNILSGGLLLNFAGSMLYCLLFRYFAGFVSARFSMVFHTVTVTAEYLTFMECTAAVLLLSRLYQTQKGCGLRRFMAVIWKEFIMFGMITAYVIFTMSRTAYLAVGVACLILLLVVVRGRGRQRAVWFGRSVLVCILAAAVCFPAAFTLQRIVPAVVGHPYIFSIEDTVVQLHGGADWDSRSFMCVERFESMFMEKILGMEGKSYNYPEDRYNYDSNGKLIYGTDGVLLSADAAGTELAGHRGFLLASAQPTEGERQLLLASASDTADTASDASSEADSSDAAASAEPTGLDALSNGRFTIFGAYLSRMNLLGHDEMGAPLPDGEIAVHAHNTYLQVAYDHGVPAGILFMVLILSALATGFAYDRKSRSETGITALPMAITLGFAIAGLTEWVFQFSNPMTVALMLSWAPLMFRNKTGAVRG